MKILDTLPVRKQIDWVAVAAIAEEHDGVIITLEALGDGHNNAHASLHRLGYGLKRAENLDGTLVGYRTKKLKPRTT